MYQLVLAASLLVQSSLPNDRPGSQLSVREVIERWQAGADLVESYDLSLEFTSRTFVDKDKTTGAWVLLPESEALQFPTAFSRIYRKGDQRRGEFGGDGRSNYAIHIIWDGKQGITFQDGETVSTAPYIFTFGTEEHEDYESKYRTFLGTTDRINLTKERDARLLHRDGRLYVVDVPTSTKGDYQNAHWRLWLDPDRNYLPARFMQWMAKRGVETHTMDVENDLSEVAVGVWAPIRSRVRIYFSDGKSPLNGKVSFAGELTVVGERSRFNIDLPDSLFDPTIPNGTTVIDRSRNAVYTQGSSNAEQYLSQMAADEKSKIASVVRSDRRPPEMVFIPNKDQSRWRRPGVIAGTVLLALFAAYRFWRWRARGWGR